MAHRLFTPFPGIQTFPIPKWYKAAVSGSGLGRQKSATPLATGEPEWAEKSAAPFPGARREAMGRVLLRPTPLPGKLESRACVQSCTIGHSVAHWCTDTPALWGSACAPRSGKSASKWPKMRFLTIELHRLSGKNTSVQSKKFAKPKNLF